MTPTIVLCECIVQQCYLFFVKLCFDNIMSIIMKVSYMKSNNTKYAIVFEIFVKLFKIQVGVNFYIFFNVHFCTLTLKMQRLFFSIHVHVCIYVFNLQAHISFMYRYILYLLVLHV